MDRNMYDAKYYSETQAQWELFSNPLLNFIENYVEINEISGIDENYEIEKDLFLSVYNEFLRKHDQPEVKGTNILTRKMNYLKEYGQKIKTRDFQKNGRKIHFYSGIKFKERAFQEFDIALDIDTPNLNEPGTNLDNFFTT